MRWFGQRLTAARPVPTQSQRWRWPRSLTRFMAIAVLVITTVLCWDGRSPAQAITPRFYTDLEFPPLPAIQLPDYERYELANGLVVYLAEDHELPLVSGTALIRVGNRWEPAAQTGLASVTGVVMRSGGAVDYPTDVLNEWLEQRAAAIETDIGTTSGSASFNALSEDVTAVLTRFAAVLRSPAFPQDQIDLTLSQFRGSIARQNDDPGDIAEREFSELIYGSDSPYARSATYATLANIQRSDLVDFHQRYVQPHHIMLSIVGDFDRRAMRRLLNDLFGDWRSPSPPLALPPLPPVSQAQVGGVYVVDQPQLSQSSVRIGHLGGTVDQPEYAAMSVLNGVLSRFGGRLMNEVRSRQGLAYSVYAYWSPNYDFPGLFIGGGETRSETTVPFVQSVIREIERVRTAPVTPAELAYSKDSVLNSFIFNFQTPGQTLSRLMRYEYFGYPADFVFQYQQAVAAMTPEQILAAAQTLLDPSQLVTLVVGNLAAIDPPLTALAADGQVVPIDIQIPPSPAASPQTAPLIR